MIRFLHLFLFGCLCAAKLSVVAQQSGGTGFHFRGLYHNENGAGYTNASMDVKAQLYNANNGTQIFWEETHTVTTDSSGLFTIIIGAGNSTGAGSAIHLDSVPFFSEKISMLIEVDPDGSGFVVLHDGVFLAVPYAYHTLTTDQPQALIHGMTDVNSGQPNPDEIITWNGSSWIYSPNVAGSTNFVWQSGTTGYADTAELGYVNWGGGMTDTVAHAYQADSANWAQFTPIIPFVNTIVYADTATHAQDGFAWTKTGETDTTVAHHRIGTTNAQDLKFITNGIERMRIEASGSALIGTADSISNLHVHGTGGFQVVGVFGDSAYPSVTTGEMAFYAPTKAAWRSGTSTIDTLWGFTNTGNNSFAHGRNTWARDDDAQAFGDSSFVTRGANSIWGAWGSTVFGYHCNTEGRTNLVGGYKSYCMNSNSVALGYKCETHTAYAAVAMGWEAIADGSGFPAVAIGKNVNAGGRYSAAFGHNIGLTTRRATFVYSGYYPGVTFQAQAAYTFNVLATGGYTLQTDATNSAGSYILAGGGAWNSISDRTKKENFQTLNAENILKKLEQMPIYEWSYIAQPAIRHYGPTAQAFYRAFGLGGKNTSIVTTDPDGVTCIAIQGLAKRFEDLQSIYKKLEESMPETTDYKDLDARLKAMEDRLGLNKQP